MPGFEHEIGRRAVDEGEGEHRRKTANDKIFGEIALKLAEQGGEHAISLWNSRAAQLADVRVLRRAPFRRIIVIPFPVGHVRGLVRTTAAAAAGKAEIA